MTPRKFGQGKTKTTNKHVFRWGRSPLKKAMIFSIRTAGRLEEQAAPCLENTGLFQGVFNWL